MRSYKYIIIFLLFISALYSMGPSNCLYFDDQDDYVYIEGTPLQFTWRFTLECWFNIHEFSDSTALIDYGSTSISAGSYMGYGIYLLDSNRIVIRIGNSGNQSELVLSDIKANIWQHLAVTYNKYKNDENIIAFLNGRVVKKEDCDIMIQYPTTFRPYGVYLGAFYDYPYQKAMKGELDDVRFWSVVRTNEEILNSMDIEIDTSTTGLAGYYSFDQEADSVLYDRSPNGNHGHLMNMDSNNWKLSYARVAATHPSDISFERFVLLWFGAPEFDSYCIDMSTSDDFTTSCEGFPVEDVKTNYYIIDNIEPGSYYYRLKGHYDGEILADEPWTNIQSVSTVTDVATAIELADFALTEKNGSVHITWKTASQNENSRFFVERKTSGTEWNTICEKDGAGTNSMLMEYEYDDMSVKPGMTYFYRIMDMDYSGKLDSSHVLNIKTSGKACSGDISFVLNKIYPNPFNPQTSVSFTVLQDDQITISIYSSTGQQVDVLTRGYYQSGNYVITWNPGKLATGIYFLKINSKDRSETHKILYMK